MYRKLFIIFFISFLTVLGCQNNNENDNQNYTQDQPALNANGGDEAPAFTLKDINGKNVSLSDYKGKVVLIDFWATWCGPCRRGIPDLVELQKEFKDDIVVIGISLDRETINDVVPFVKSYNINYPIVYGTEEVSNSFGGIRAIPTSFVIDTKGNIVDKHVGLVSKTVYSNRIKELLGKS